MLTTSEQHELRQIEQELRHADRGLGWQLALLQDIEPEYHEPLVIVLVGWPRPEAMRPALRNPVNCPTCVGLDPWLVGLEDDPDLPGVFCPYSTAPS